jgi:hypothetical protein
LKISVVLTSLLTLVSASFASASPISVPPGVVPGSTYYLAFVTDGTRDAISSNIADYDAFVTAEANLDPSLAALGTTWKAIGSTSAVSAIAHIGVTGAVYNLQGQLVATNSADMFDGTLASAIEFDQYGSLAIRAVWTGSTLAGTSNTPLTLGAFNAELAQSDFTDFRWIAFTSFQWDNSESLYGISGPLIAPTTAQAVPEPCTMSLILGPVLLGGVRRWRRSS